MTDEIDGCHDEQEDQDYVRGIILVLEMTLKVNQLIICAFWR